MKQVIIFVIAILVSLCLAGVAFADGSQTATKSTDTKNASPPATKKVKPDVHNVSRSSTPGNNKGESGAAITTKQSKQQHDRAKQTIDNLK